MTTGHKTLKERINDSRIHAKIKNAILTTATLMAVCVGASAQTKEKQEKDDKEGVKTEVKVAANNIAALNFQSVNTVENKFFEQATEKNTMTCYPSDFFLQSIPSIDFGIEKGIFYGKVGASEIVTLKNANLSTLNNKMMLETGMHFGDGTKVCIKTGREATEVGANFFNGVPGMAYETNSRSIAAFGNLNERMVLGVEKNGAFIELGMVSPYGKGFIIVPNPKQADFWGKVSKSFEKDGVQIFVSAATQLGQNNKKIFASVSATYPLGEGKMGVSAGGNYNINSKEWNAFLREAYTSTNSGMQYVFEAAKKGESYSLHLGVGKKGVQGFVMVDSVSVSQDVENLGNLGVSTTNTTTVGVGVSYSFGGGRKL